MPKLQVTYLALTAFLVGAAICAPNSNASAIERERPDRERRLNLIDQARILQKTLEEQEDEIYRLTQEEATLREEVESLKDKPIMVLTSNGEDSSLADTEERPIVRFLRGYQLSQKDSNNFSESLAFIDPDIPSSDLPEYQHPLESHRDRCVRQIRNNLQETGECEYDQGCTQKANDMFNTFLEGTNGKKGVMILKSGSFGIKMSTNIEKNIFDDSDDIITATSYITEYHPFVSSIPSIFDIMQKHRVPKLRSEGLIAIPLRMDRQRHFRKCTFLSFAYGTFKSNTAEPENINDFTENNTEIAIIGY